MSDPVYDDINAMEVGAGYTETDLGLLANNINEETWCWLGPDALRGMGEVITDYVKWRTGL